MTDKQTNERTDICDCRVAFATEKVLYDGNVTLVFSRESDSAIINVCCLFFVIWEQIYEFPLKQTIFKSTRKMLVTVTPLICVDFSVTCKK